MSKPKLTVIEGGLSTSKINTDREFAGAYITNTRLMGVMGMYVHWKLTGYPSAPDFHQFFYFDAEEYGFESYRSVMGNKVEEISRIEQTMINGLGGRKIELTEREVRAILWKYMLFNHDNNIPLPEDYHEYEFLLDREVVFAPSTTPVTAASCSTDNTPAAEPEKAIHFSAAEQTELIMKICDPIASPFHAINYFLMRCFGHDYESAEWLCRNNVDVRLYEDMYPMATFCKNSIDFDEAVNSDNAASKLRGCEANQKQELTDKIKSSINDYSGKATSPIDDNTSAVTSSTDDSCSYLCESLIEYDNEYYIIVSRVTVDGELMISDFEPCSSFKISSMEAAMMLSKPEFITVYETLIPVDEFASLLAQVPLNCLITPHDNGKLYMMFHNHNNHVNKQVFMLSADVAGIYYLNDSGQLLAVAYDLPAIHALEKDLRKSVLSPYVVATDKYEFKEPVLYDYIESDFDDFNEFIEFIQV